MDAVLEGEGHRRNRSRMEDPRPGQHSGHVHFNFGKVESRGNESERRPSNE